MPAKKPREVNALRSSILDDATIVQQPMRPISKWTVGDLESILSETENGELRRLGDFAESLWTDTQIRSTGEQRILGLQSLPISFNGDLEDEIAAPAFWKLFPAAELAKAHRYALMCGTAIFYMRDINPRMRVQDKWLPRAEAWHPRFYHFDQMAGLWRVETWNSPGYQYIEPDDPNWLTVSPFGANRPWAEGLWRALGFPWIIKRFAVFDMSRHSEVSGSPIRVGLAPQGSTQRQRVAWQTLLQRLGRDAAMVLPPGYDLKLVEAVGKGELYQSEIGWADTAFAKIWTGQPITSEGSNMGFGEGTVFENIKLDLIKFDAKFLSEGISPWLDNWAQINYGKSCGFQFRTEPPQKLEERSRGLTALGEAISAANTQLAADGLKVDAARLYREAGVPVIDSRQKSNSAQVFRYHLEYGIMTVNEVRESLGLDAIPNGDKVPVPYLPTDPGRSPEETGIDPEPAEPDPEPAEPDPEPEET